MSLIVSSHKCDSNCHKVRSLICGGVGAHAGIERLELWASLIP